MAKKVYFACSVRSGGDTSQYLAILDAIKSAGGEVLSEVFVNDAIQFGGSPLPSEDIYERDTKMIESADAVIAEVSSPSLGVGYELAYAEQRGKPVLCLFNQEGGRRLSAMVGGNPYNKLVTYSPEALPLDEIRQFVQS